MANTTATPSEVKATIVMNRRQWERFKRKCRKANTNASERLRELIKQDLKV